MMKNSIWSKNINEELDYWRGWLKEFPNFTVKNNVNDFINKIELNKCMKDLPEPIKVIDIGCGLIPALCYANLEKKMNLVTVDVLAEEYIKILSDSGVKVPVLPIKGHVEELDKIFPAESFDFVYMQNSLDHCYDPIKGLKQLIRLAKPNCYIYLKHHVNVGEWTKYHGLHQWDFDCTMFLPSLPVLFHWTALLCPEHRF